MPWEWQRLMEPAFIPRRSYLQCTRSGGGRTWTVLLERLLGAPDHVHTAASSPSVSEAKGLQGRRHLTVMLLTAKRLGST